MFNANELDLNPAVSAAILDTLHCINMAKGRGQITSYTRNRGQMNGVAMRRIPMGHGSSMPYRFFTFHLFTGRDGILRIRALGLVRKVESV